MSRRILLSIGRDRSIGTVDSPFYSRMQVYEQSHTFIQIVMAVGEARELQIGTCRVYLTGGSNTATAFFKAVAQAWRLARNEKIDIVTTQDVLYAGLLGYLISRWFSLPLFVQLHGDYLDNPLWFASQVGQHNRVMNVVGKYILRRATSVRAVSARLRTQLIVQFGIAPERVHSIPIGTNLSIFARTTSTLRKNQLLFVGRLLPEKEPLLFCEVAATILERHSDFTIGIAGDGFMRADMETFLANKGVLERCHFYGNLDLTAVAELYATSFCYIHTAGWEGWGMPMIEAMAAGCPVITTDSGCAGEAIRHLDTGMVSPVGDVSALIANTEKIIADTRLWNSLISNGKTEAVVWSATNLTNKLVKWYESEK